MIASVRFRGKVYDVQVVGFSIGGGIPETPPSYSHGGIPGEPVYLEDVVLVGALGGELPFDFDDLDDEDRVRVENAIWETLGP